MNMAVEAPVVDTNSELKKTVGRVYLKERHGTKTPVILREVKAHKVVLQCEGREDKFNVTIAEFLKFYHLRPGAKAND